jgi:hypothetical protein
VFVFLCVALFIQSAKRICFIILFSVACPAVPYFYTLFYKRRDLPGKVIEYKMCGLIYLLQYFSEIFIILSIV